MGSAGVRQPVIRRNGKLSLILMREGAQENRTEAAFCPLSFLLCQLLCVWPGADQHQAPGVPAALAAYLASPKHGCGQCGYLFPDLGDLGLLSLCSHFQRPLCPDRNVSQLWANPDDELRCSVPSGALVAGFRCRPAPRWHLHVTDPTTLETRRPDVLLRWFRAQVVTCAWPLGSRDGVSVSRCSPGKYLGAPHSCSAFPRDLSLHHKCLPYQGTLHSELSSLAPRALTYQVMGLQ